MRKYALIKNNTVIGTADLEDDALKDAISTHDMVIDINDQVPQPVTGYVLNGNVLEIPQNHSSWEQYEIELNSRKVDFGIKLARYSIDRIGARNKILNKNGAQVIALLTQLLGVKSLMETGALGTSRSACYQFKYVFTEYSDILDDIIGQINSFEANFGL